MRNLTPDDDVFVGQVLNRREALIVLAGATAAGATYMIGCSGAGNSQQSNSLTSTVPGCVARPALTEGPFFVDEKLNRSDIRSDPTDGVKRPGVDLQLTFNLSRVVNSTCVAAEGYMVDVWHCDALGAYSDVNDPNSNAADKKFLRGFQLSGSDGKAQFTTIYPGWYQGRAVHIHFKIRSSTTSAKALEFTSQLFFDEATTDVVHAMQPYAQKGQRTLKNSGDGIYNQSGGQMVLDAKIVDSGYAASFDIAID